MLTKMAILCLLNVEKIWNSAQINLSSILNFYQIYVFDATISTEKSTSEIDADLAQDSESRSEIDLRRKSQLHENDA